VHTSAIDPIDVSDGVESMHRVSAGSLVVDLNERLGGEITRVRFDGHDVLASYDWAAPVGATHSTSYGDARLDWLSEYRGGWQLLVPNAGAACEVAGVPLPFHGEWSRTHVTVTEREAARVVVSGGTRLPLNVTREVSVHADPQRVVVRTTVENVWDDDVSFVWGEHPAFAVEPGDLVDFPAADVFDEHAVGLGRWSELAEGGGLDRVPDETGTSLHFLVGMSCGWAAIRRPHVGVALAWDVADFPYAWLWREVRSPGFPFFGRASILAIEPACSWPGTGLLGAIERNQAVVLAAGERRSTSVALIPFEPDGRSVTSVSISGHIEFS
jgi:hypothetical protein